MSNPIIFNQWKFHRSLLLTKEHQICIKTEKMNMIDSFSMSRQINLIIRVSCISFRSNLITMKDKAWKKDQNRSQNQKAVDTAEKGNQDRRLQ